MAGILGLKSWYCTKGLVGVYVDRILGGTLLFCYIYADDVFIRLSFEEVFTEEMRGM